MPDFEKDFPVKDFEKDFAPKPGSAWYNKPSGSGVFGSPQGFMGPGLLANLDAKIRGGTPQKSEAHINQTFRTAGPLAASLALGPMGYLASIPTQGALQAGFTGATKGTPGEMATAGALGAGAQAVIGGIAKIAELAINKRAATQLIAREAARAKSAMDSYEAKQAFDKSMAKALTTVGKSNWTQDVKAAEQKFGDEAAGRVMDAWKEKVPAWKDLPSNTRGITDAVVGKGPDLASAAFDRAMKDIVAQGAGKQIPLAREVAQKIGLEVPPAPQISPQVRELLAAAGRPVPPPDNMAMVDAGKAAEAVLGKWRKFPVEYRATVAALDNAGLGSQEARSSYAAAQGLRDVVDKTGAIGERGLFDVNKLLDGLQKVKISDVLRKRGLGNALEGDLANATQGSPLTPPQPAPIIPPPNPKPGGPLSPEDLGIETASEGSKASMGGLAGHLAGYAAGMPFGHPWMGSVFGGGIGAGIGRKLPDLVTKTPITGGISDALRSAAMAAGAVAPQALTPGPLTPQPPDRATQAALDAEWEARFGGKPGQ